MGVGVVFDIQRFCTHDGPGIRTVVFLKGCTLDCAWCHNPESKSPHPELFHNADLCIACGRCIEACPAKAHEIVDGKLVFSRARCSRCMRCAEACPAGALETTGREMTVEQVIAEVEKDRVFYDESGGGMTLSGGEPMSRFAFARELLTAARSAGLHTCFETSGFGKPERFAEIAPLVDLFLWDIKDTDSQRHITNTGVPLDPILSNLKLIDQSGGKTVLRCVMLNGVNLIDSHLDRLAEIHGALSHCRGVELLPYHALGDSKHARLGRRAKSDPAWTPSDEQIAAARTYLQERWGL